MLWYDGKVFYSVEDILRLIPNAPQDFGVFPVHESIPCRNEPIEGLAVDGLTLRNEVYWRSYATYTYDISTLLSMLTQWKNKLREHFAKVFAEIDARSPRSSRGIVIALVDGSFPKEDDPNLTPEQQQRIVDVGIMWELEEVAQVNRDMQTELLALEITEDMTLEQAQEITLRIANAKPWLPWRE